MKKKLFVIAFIMVVSLLVVGCGKKVEEKEVDNNKTIDSDYKVTMSQTFEFMDEDVKEIFNKAINNYTSMKLTPLAYFGEQVVAGKNYMLLCESDNGYKVVVIYHDLEGNSTVTKVTDFNIKEYINEKYELNTEVLSGGWHTEIPGKAIALDDREERAFNLATQALVGVTYYPITVFDKEDSNGHTYAMVCYGRISDQNGTTGVYVLTISSSNKDEVELVSIANIDLSKYNK